MSLPFADNAILSALWRYWNKKRGTRSMPLRSDIDPGEIPKLLPHIQLMERDPARGFRYRLSGTAVAQVYGFDPTGKYIDDLLPPDRQALANGHCLLAWNSGKPLFTRSRYTKPTGVPAEVTRLILPLSLDGTSVGMLLLGQTFAAAAPAAAGDTIGIDDGVAADTSEAIEPERGENDA
ncbi:MAG: PAS domain-containing protein [Rhodospirillaceae bacterium]|nr:PAS domain-containing protein [Rhodospirillaceae bacterium]